MPSDELLPATLSQQVAAELRPGEKLVWAGQPRLDLATRAKIFLIPFGLVFTGFSGIRRGNDGNRR